MNWRKTASTKSPCPNTPKSPKSLKYLPMKLNKKSTEEVCKSSPILIHCRDWTYIRIGVQPNKQFVKSRMHGELMTNPGWWQSEPFSMEQTSLQYLTSLRKSAMDKHHYCPSRKTTSILTKSTLRRLLIGKYHDHQRYESKNRRWWRTKPWSWLPPKRRQNRYHYRPQNPYLHSHGRRSWRPLLYQWLPLPYPNSKMSGRKVLRRHLFYCQ